MSRETGFLWGKDQAELWSRWYETSPRSWWSVLGSEGEVLADPFGLYRHWVGFREDARKSPEGATLVPVRSQELWRQWTEATTETWRKSFEAWDLLMTFVPHWAEMAERVRKQMFEAGSPPANLPDLYSRWYSATSGPLS
ncbi:Hypothetical Protein RradSPS_2603 [Rubrobacter radiotolerans]|nr:Hypothetical Protein RradSPS_2603 [Rubrobacter radiotolerans]SMC07815.1 E3 binding protein [Rubrobacter radiotolerans DSM 5868]